MLGFLKKQGARLLEWLKVDSEHAGPGIAGESEFYAHGLSDGYPVNPHIGPIEESNAVVPAEKKGILDTFDLRDGA
jgi:hypothetical protein